MKSNDISLLIPAIIRRVRKEKSFSQEDLARLANLDRTYISGIEREDRNITIKSLSKILSALEIDIDNFALELIHQNRAQKSIDKQ
ncbi:MAG: transcriptional regulator with XRE-family HTH domain [Desulforhopalus sp.]|jgi:transcriptional regulator with XRE-family HTH domain